MNIIMMGANAFVCLVPCDINAGVWSDLGVHVPEEHWCDFDWECQEIELQTVMPIHVIPKPLYNSGSLDLKTQREFIWKLTPTH